MPYPATKTFVLATLLLTPLLIYYHDIGFEQSKVLFFIIGIALSLIVWQIEQFIYKKEILIKFTPLKLLAFIFFISLGVTSITGINQPSSIFGKPPYYQGLILYFFLFALFLIVSTLKLSQKAVALTYALSSTIVGFLALKDFVLLEFFNQNVLTYSGRVVSTFGQPNFFAGFILINLPFVLYAPQFLKKYRAFCEIVLLGISSLAIIASQSRSAIVILGICYLAFFIWRLNKSSLKIKSVLIILILASVSLFSIFLFTDLVWKEVIQPLNHEKLEGGSPEKRILIWEITQKLIEKRPIFGYGIENISQAYTSYFKNEVDFNSNKIPSYHSLKDLTVSSAHSYFLDLLLYSGFLGGIIYLALVITLLKKKKPISLQLSLIIYLTWAQFQNQSIANLIQFWVIASLIDQSVDS